ncbi:MAG: Nramp family divalent metal transporter [Prolixibacteraceae bacterium]|nr:Nramp family divalent metal transporter [Prolixibacteraceae bacterium]
MKNFNWKAIGPGLIWAGAAIGVSHMVQSTRAGADYGFQLVIVVILANLFKYPFFQYGPRYAIATGESLIEAYHRMGKWVLGLFLLLTVGTMFAILAAVTSVTVGIITSVLPSSLSYVEVTLLLLVICAIIILLGQYKTLDRLMKAVVLILTISTLVAFFVALAKSDGSVLVNQQPFEWTVGNVAFVIALVGWMPSAIDISVWNSLWTLAKIESTGYRPKLKEVLFDFNVGYLGTVIIALAFLGLGALVMFNSGQEFANGGTQFAKQFLALYTQSIGKWAFVVVAIASIATMFSTTLTVLDAYPRVLNPVAGILLPVTQKPRTQKRLAWLWMFVLVTGAIVIISKLSEQMKLLVDVATTLSFLTAPVLGYLNLKAIISKQVPAEFRPSKGMLLLSWTGLIVLSGFALYYLLMKLGVV